MYRPSANQRFTIQVERRSITSASVSHRMLDPTTAMSGFLSFDRVADLFIHASMICRHRAPGILY